MKKIILLATIHVAICCTFAQPCAEVNGLKPIPFLYTFNGNPGTTIEVIPGNWNRLYKLDETTGALTAETCVFACCPTYGLCVCYVPGIYFRRVTPPCDPTPCGGDLPLPGMPKTDNSSLGDGWSLGSTWMANQVPDIALSPAVLITKSTRIDQDISIVNDHWLILTSGSSAVLAGKTITNNGVIKIYAAASFENFGTINGNGQIFGTLVNSGTLSPGNSPGKLSIIGNYNATALAVHRMEIASANLYDTISIDADVTFESGHAVLDGSLDVSLSGSYIPAPGDAFKIFTFKSSTGFFSGTSLPTLPNGLIWSIEYNATDVTLRVMTGTLPVQFVKVNAYQNGSGVQVDWIAANELSLKTYDVEKSTDGIHFFKAVTVFGNTGGSNNNYHWFDTNPVNVISYYRVKAIDEDGKFVYSITILVKITENKKIAIYPNPVIKGGSLYIRLQNIRATKIEIINMLAQVVYSNSSKLTGAVSIPVSNAIPPGQYLLRIISVNNVHLKKIQIQ